MGQVGCKWGKCAASGLQVGQVDQVGCKWPGRASVPKWTKCAASGLQAATQWSRQKSLPQTVFCVRETAAIFKPSTDTGDPLRTAFSGLPPHAKSPSKFTHFEGDFGEVDSGL